ncbi:MAG TPA: hypothetical protein VHO25_23785 [Polyangiaceae bacterium]|nr:hypothetical protein [Polyangiaceae bacterium]
MTGPDDSERAVAFGRSFVAMQYLLGRRDRQLSLPDGLSGTARRACETLVHQLSAADKASRARALAPELALLVKALQQRELA